MAISTDTWTADSDYVYEGTGIICTLGGRAYNKVNSGKAMVAYANFPGSTWNGPLLVSTDPDLVRFSPYGDIKSTTTFEYIGLVFYVSSASGFMTDSYSSGGIAKKLSGTFESEVAAGQALCAAANCRVPYSTKYLIKSGNTYYSIINNELSTLSITELTGDNFTTYGFDDLNGAGTLLKNLSEFTIYKWLSASGEIDNISLNVTATPPAQTIVSDNIDFKDPSIAGMSGVDIVSSGAPLFAISKDGGTKWMYFNGTTWDETNESTFGMTADVLHAVTAEQWTALGLSDTYKLKIYLPTSTDTVTSVKFNYENKES